jgi:hypothetical protein
VLYQNFCGNLNDKNTHEIHPQSAERDGSCLPLCALSCGISLTIEPLLTFIKHAPLTPLCLEEIMASHLSYFRQNSSGHGEANSEWQSKDWHR